MPFLDIDDNLVWCNKDHRYVNTKDCLGCDKYRLQSLEQLYCTYPSSEQKVIKDE